MHGTIEWAKGRAGFIRVGPRHFEHGDDYEFFVGFDAIDGVAEIKGLVTDEGSPLKTDFELTRAHVRAATDALAAVGLRAFWKRARHMPKVKIPNKADAKNADGSINHDVLKQHLAVVAGQFEDGHHVVVDMGDEDRGNGVTRHWFDTKETDPRAAAE